MKCHLIWAVIVLTVLSSCKKSNFTSLKSEESALSVNPSKIARLPVTQKEIELVENLGKVTQVLKKVYLKKENVMLVNAAILSRIYTDNSILIKDLIYPETSRLQKSKKFLELSERLGLSLANFSKEFLVEAHRLNDSSFELFLDKLNTISNDAVTDIGKNLVDPDTGASIYFPYQDEFIDPNGYGYGSYTIGSIVSVATATADADEGIGEGPVFDANGYAIGFFQVLINDDYAFAHPTHIIGVNGIEPIDVPETNSYPALPPANGNFRVYIGEGICKVQLDHLISFSGNGGGSEMIYNRLTGYLKIENGQITEFKDMFQVDFSRSDIKKQRWKRFFGIWDPNWVNDDLEQVLAIYEKDQTNNIVKFTGNLSTTATIPIPGGGSVTGQRTLGFEVQVHSNNSIQRQLKIKRIDYLAGALVDQGNGFTNDLTFIPSGSGLKWPAYEVHYTTKQGASVGWTWPYNTY